MKARVAVASLIVMAAAGLAVAAIRRQEGPQGVKPGKFHEYMKQLEGNWESQNEFRMTPDGELMKSKGTETAKLVCGGLFLIAEVASDMSGMPFEGHSIMGYDEHKKKYTGSWVDNMSTAIWTSEGTVDAAGKVFTATMEGPDPSGKMMKMKMITEITGKDTRKLTFHVPGPDGKDFEMGKIEYTRKK